MTGTRQQIRSGSWGYVVLAVLAVAGAAAVWHHNWGALAATVIVLFGYALYQAWAYGRRIELDPAGQPASGRDADRLAVANLRAYVKAQRHNGGR